MFIPSKDLALRAVTEFGSPLFLTDKQALFDNAAALQKAFSIVNTKIFYAIKANYNPGIVQAIKEAGIYGIDAVSRNEVQHALSLGYKPEEIIFTPSNPGTEVIREIGELGIMQNLGSLSELRRYCELFPGTKISLRVSPGIGAGEFDQISTGGIETKFGLIQSDLEEAVKITDEYNVAIAGIHSHIGSGFYEASVFKHYVETVLGIVKDHAQVEFVDFGGGFGVQYRLGGQEINLDDFAEVLKAGVDDFESETGRSLEYRIEPGKYLVSNSTVLLGTVTTMKQKGTITFVGLDTGFHHYIRPAMYGAYQHIVNVSRPEGDMKLVEVVGNVCETCDVFNSGIEVSDPKEGDVLAILVAGGYGASMSSNYNMRGMAAEAMLDGDTLTRTKRAQTLEDITQLFV